MYSTIPVKIQYVICAPRSRSLRCRGAAGAVLVFDVTNRRSFGELDGWLRDLRALAPPGLVVLLVGNKRGAPSESVSRPVSNEHSSSVATSISCTQHSLNSPPLHSPPVRADLDDRREVTFAEAARFASQHRVSYRFVSSRFVLSHLSAFLSGAYRHAIRRALLLPDSIHSLTHSLNRVSHMAPLCASA